VDEGVVAAAQQEAEVEVGVAVVAFPEAGVVGVAALGRAVAPEPAAAAVAGGHGAALRPVVGAALAAEVEQPPLRR